MSPFGQSAMQHTKLQLQWITHNGHVQMGNIAEGDSGLCFVDRICGIPCTECLAPRVGKNWCGSVWLIILNKYSPSHPF